MFETNNIKNKQLGQASGPDFQQHFSMGPATSAKTKS
jgi:hypothetical protein